MVLERRPKFLIENVRARSWTHNAGFFLCEQGLGQKSLYDGERCALGGGLVFKASFSMCID